MKNCRQPAVSSTVKGSEIRIERMQTVTFSERPEDENANFEKQD
jgi:hypothetical protein